MHPAKNTDVYVWSSFSCNNSSDYRLVAEKTKKGYAET